MPRAIGQSAFTLLELLVTIAVTAVLATVAIPALGEFVAHNRVAAQTNELVGALHLARNVAVTRGLPVTVCATDDRQTGCTGDADWTQGWIVFIDDRGRAGVVDAGDSILRAYPRLHGSAKLTTSGSFIRYRPDGFLDSEAVTFSLRMSRCTLSGNRSIAITPQGRASVTNAAC